MKSVTEFFSFTLIQGQKLKEEFLAAGKTIEEVAVAIGEKMKLKEEKIKHFMASLEVAAANQENLKRVHVVTLNEGEASPAKAVKVEEHTYIPEFQVLTKQVPVKLDPKARGKGGGGKGGGNQNRGAKESPWGLSEEQKAEKKKAQTLAAAAARAAKPS